MADVWLTTPRPPSGNHATTNLGMGTDLGGGMGIDPGGPIDRSITQLEKQNNVDRSIM